MPTKTYKALANITLGGTATSVTFASIPATYRDLVIVVNGTTASSADIGLRFNGTSSPYSFLSVYSDGSAISNNNGNYPQSPIHYSPNTTDFVVTANVMDYSATDKHKTVLSRGNQNTAFVDMYASRWGNTSAITSVQVRTDGANFSSGTTFALYGIES